MANFYAKVKELITDCDISYIEPLTYIKLFSSHEDADASTDKIILLYNRGEPSEQVQIKPVKEDYDYNAQTNRLDLTGSPLKDSCEFELLNDSMPETLQTRNAWKDDEELYHCIPFADAQSHFNQILSAFRSQDIPKCWAICESNDNTLLTSNEKHGNKWIRGILKFTGVTPFEPIDLAMLQAKHLKYVVKQYGPIEGLNDSYYRLGSDSVLQVSYSINGPISKSNITDGKTASKMVLHQSVQINNFESIAHKFWIQLGILNDIKDTIVAYKETKNPTCLNFKGSQCGGVDEIKQEIYEMLTQPIPIGSNDNDDDDGSSHKPSTNIDKIVDNAKLRVSGELTDQLWDVLKGCSSYNILKEVIEYIFTTAAKINVVNMPSSESRLANLIRDVCDHRIAIPRLSGTEPLELLLEVGLEKINKDYEYIFTESRLCSAEELQADKKLALANGGLNVRKSLKTQFATNGTGAAPRKTLMHKLSEQMTLNDSKEKVGFQNSQFNLQTVDGDLARLGRIHLILEHLLKIKLNLNLENVFTTFLDVLHKPLVPFDVLRETVNDFQTITITNTKILTKIGNIPHQQRIYLKSRNQFQIIRNTFYFSSAPIFPPHVFKCIENNDMDSNSFYYGHQYLEIEQA